MAVALKPTSSEWSDEELAVKVRERVQQGLDAGESLHSAAQTAADEIIDQGWAEAMFRLFGARLIYDVIWRKAIAGARGTFFDGHSVGTKSRTERSRWMQPEETEGEAPNESILDALLFRCGERRYIPLGDMTQADCLIQRESAAVQMRGARKRVLFWEKLAIGLDKGQTVRQRFSEEEIYGLRNQSGAELESDPEEEE